MIANDYMYCIVEILLIGRNTRLLLFRIFFSLLCENKMEGEREETVFGQGCISGFWGEIDVFGLLAGHTAE